MRRGGGIITVEDMRRYQPVWREAIRSTYRGYTLLTMPPSSSGGVTITETMNVLETVPSMPPFGSAQYFHLLGSAYQRAFVDRNEALADPAFAVVPTARLTSKEYARGLAATIGENRATPTAVIESKLRTLREGTQTTHYSVVDGAGNAVATTTTINGLFGSGVWVRGAGFFLNNEMDDFAAQPGTPNQFGLVQGEVNAVQPGKRPLSAMSPTIVLDPNGELLLVIGGRGGPRIITATSQIILNVIDHRMNLADAMSAPRIHHQALPDSLRYERHGLLQSTLDSLTAMGYGLAPVGTVAEAHGVMRVKGGWEGFVDPRTSGGALGY
jgi:gamma-glutamyltranspeptidase/glutathione hydrolase